MKPLTMDQLLMRDVDNRASEFPPTMQMLINGDILLKQLNALQDLMQVQFIIHSGYRPGHYNTDAGGAKYSPHLTCEAADLHFEGNSLATMQFKIDSNESLLVDYKLYRESPKHTPTWMHLQTRPTLNRTFIP